MFPSLQNLRYCYPYQFLKCKVYKLGKNNLTRNTRTHEPFKEIKEIHFLADLDKIVCSMRHYETSTEKHVENEIAYGVKEDAMHGLF